MIETDTDDLAEDVCRKGGWWVRLVVLGTARPSPRLQSKQDKFLRRRTAQKLKEKIEQPN